MDGVVHDRGAQRRAALPGRAEAGEQRALDREVEVGVVHDHQRVLAAQLEARRLQVAPAQRADLARRPRSSPVKPTLSTSPSLERALEPGEGLRALGLHDVEHAVGQPARDEQPRHARRPSAGAYSAGFHTTALPHSSAGTRYHDGTATGKLPAVMIAATPTGTRKVNSCLSGISLGTVCP